MKKRLIGTGLAISLALSNIGALPSVAAVDNTWKADWTGKEGSSSFTVTATEDNKVVMENQKANNGKFSDGEDSIIYYAKELSNDNNFIFTATVSIDEYNTIAESSNPQQGSVGIGVLDSLYHKTDDISYDDGIFLGTYAPSKSDDLTIRAMSRNSSDKKTVGEALSDPMANEGSGLGIYKLSIVKEGNMYTLSCGKNTEVVEMTSLEDEIYPCLYIARNVKATFTDVNLTVDTKKALSIELSGDYKKEYIYGDKLDISSLKGMVIYDNGTREETKDFLVKGYDPHKVGKQTVTLSKGAASVSIPVEVHDLEVTNITVDYAPVKTDYAMGDLFKTQGIQVSADYSNGTHALLEPDQYYFMADGREIKEGDKIAGTGKKQIKVCRIAEEGLHSNTAGSFTINVNKSKVTELEAAPPVKTVYYLGDELDTTGMTVRSKYINDVSKEIIEIMKPEDYKLSGFESTVPGTKTVKVTSVANPDVSAEFTVNVLERKYEKPVLVKYPRTTYAVGEDFDATDMIVASQYDNGDIEPVEDYSVDKSQFDTTKAGTTYVTVSDGIAAEGITLPITVVESMNNTWRGSTFGQSSGYDKGIEIVGTIPEVPGTAQGKITVRAWDGAGKITNDHDGMTYYFTDIAGSSDFKISADITVVKYLEHDNDDTKRNGQEAFGIMARDVVPLEGTDGSVVIDPSGAKIGENGVAAPVSNNKVFASNIALFGGYSGTGWPTDPASPSYEKNTNINRINLLIRNGVTATDGGGTRIGPYAVSSDFPKEGNKYRLTLERMNGGLYAKCYNYQTEETLDTYYYDDSFLTVQEPNVAYVGFFASRWAEIDVENVEFYETVKDTDQTIANNETTASTPAIYFRDDRYSTSTEYRFKLDVDDSYGKVTVKMNDKVVAQDQPINNISEFKANLNANSVNKLVAVYTPDETLNLTSYEPIIIRENIYHKSYNSSIPVIYASPDGSFKASGTKEFPYDLDTAVGFLEPGQTLILKNGVYKRTEPLEIILGDNGEPDRMKTVEAETEGKVIIDGQNITANAIVTGNYWHFKGIEFVNSAENQKAFHLGGSHNIIENCKFHDNRDMGLQISRVSGLQEKEDWPSYNTVINCESYNNCDPSMINADGFGAKLTVGEGNRFVGCKSHNNVDDGWDLYTKVGTGAIGAVTLENCESYRNGWRLNPDGTETPYNAGGNNGFKCGGENVAVQHMLINCKAYGNGNNGITTNSNPALKIVNCQVYDNAGANVRLYSAKPDEYNYDVQGIISYNGGEPDVVGTLTQETEYTNASAAPLASEINYWCKLKGTLGVNSLGIEMDKQ